DQNWEAGIFSTWIDRRIRVVAYGVLFNIDDLFENCPTAFESQKPEKVSSGAGRRMSPHWPAWVAEVAAYVYTDGFPPGRGADGVEEFIGEIEARLQNRGLEAPARSTVQQAARAALTRIREVAGK